MFKAARIKLTIIYSIFFLSFFFAMSIGMYYWLDNFFHMQYEHEMHQRCLIFPYGPDICENEQPASNIGAQIALDRLRTILLIFNGSLLLLIPSSAWLLTGKSLRPVEEAHQRERQFMSAAAHDLRTPLTVLQSELEIALHKKRTIVEYNRVLKSSKEETERLISLVENLLFLARQNGNQQPVEFTQVDVLDTLQSVITHQSPLLKKKHLQLIFSDLPEQTIHIQGNKQLLERLFANVLDNAIKYSHEPGTIAISLKQTDSHVLVRIKDTGVGISPTEQTKIFQPFYRVDSARSEKGYGMGLAICQTIAQLHHGEVAVASKLGQGATFTIRLPFSG